MRVTEREICGSFRRAENQKQQIQILTELTCKSKYQIIGILLRNGEKVPKNIENQLYKRLDALDAQIFECEMEYKEIATALVGENGRNEHGNRIQRHGGIEQKQQGRSFCTVISWTWETDSKRNNSLILIREEFGTWETSSTQHRVDSAGRWRRLTARRN